MENDDCSMENIYEKDTVKETVTHLWNLTKHLASTDNPVAKDMQMYYVQICRRLREDIELPEKCFGTAKMCSYCGLLWKPGNHTVRIIQGRQPTKMMKKLINSHNNLNQLSRYRITLIKKCIRNQTQKMCIKCLNCMKITNIMMMKPQRKAIIDINNKGKSSAFQKTKGSKAQMDQKIKTKLKNHLDTSNCTAQMGGISISNLYKTPVQQKINSKTRKNLTPIQKVKKFNKEKLENAFNDSLVTKKRNSLSAFLSELH